METRKIAAINNKKIIAMIPARMGSTRLARKNLALINGRPMIYYAVNAALQAGIFDKIIINSEEPVFSKIAQRYGVEFYKRPSRYAGSNTKSDSVVYDFMQKNPGDILVWVNPISPLQTGEEIQRVVRYFLGNQLDSLITVCNEQVHCIFDGRPLNYDPHEVFARTQDLRPISRFVYSIMIWRYTAFKKDLKKKGCALFCGRFGTYQVSKFSSLIVKTEEDLRIVDYILAGREERADSKVIYDELATKSLG